MAKQRTAVTKHGTTTPIMTTLYDLIAVLDAHLAPGDEDLITAAVLYLIDTGCLTFLGEHKHCRIVCA